MDEMSDPRSVEEARSLVLAAFRRARRTGKDDWYRMRTAVLKNRLLDVTDRKFDEREFGVDRFSAFVELLSDTLTTDRSSTPVLAILADDARAELEGEGEPRPLISRRTFRVRSDLWNSVLDYSSAPAWRWNFESAVAEPVRDLTRVDPEAILPTIDRGKLVELRSRFVTEHADELGPGASETASLWATELRGSDVLPPELRRRWFDLLKRYVFDVLTAWFSEHGVSMPVDAAAASPRDHVLADDLSGLRALASRCIEVMTVEELKNLNIPIQVVQRLQP